MNQMNQMNRTSSKRDSHDKESCYDACVIGAGASGLAAASALAMRGYRTVIVEQNKKSGRKLYATGNGRCNLANAVLSDSAYYDNSFANSVVTEDARKDLILWLRKIGIPLISRGDYLYPKSMQASSVVWALTDAARFAGVKFLYESKVISIHETEESDPRLWMISISGKAEQSLTAKRLVLATGSPAAQTLGAAKDNELARLFNDLKLPVSPWHPALCPLETKEDMSFLAGVRSGCRMTLKETYVEEGEIQFTDYGISGIVTFNLATIAEPGDPVSLNLLPEWQDEKEVLRFLREISLTRSAFGALNGFLHEKICSHAIEQICPGKGKRSLSEWKDEELLAVIRYLMAMPLTVKSKRGDQGQAYRGGILTEVLDPGTMQVKDRPNLAVTGEVSDVVGRCGGYNLMYALISGRLAGRNL